MKTHKINYLHSDDSWCVGHRSDVQLSFERRGRRITKQRMRPPLQQWN